MSDPGGPGGAGEPDPGELDPGLGEAVAALATRVRVLVALDFDGTLAPIVADAGSARALPAADRALRALAEADGVRVALVSGRGMADLRAVADPPLPVLLVASHGAEVEDSAVGDAAAGDAGAATTLDDAARTRLEQVVEELGAVVAAHEGTALERKAAGAVLHTRRALPDVGADAAAAALTGPATLPGVHALRGKEVVELSVVQADKGAALARLRERLGAEAVLYAGDDTTDEDAFAVLDDDAGDVTVKVGEGDTAARWRVQGPQDVALLLTRLVALRT